MPNLNDKAIDLIDKINSMGGVPAECQDELDSLKQDARDLNQARLGRESALKNQSAGYGTAAGSVVVGGTCLAAAPTTGPAVPVTVAGCLVVMGVGVVFGWLWGEGSDDALEAAEGEMEDVLNTMAKDVNKLCNCLKNHAP